MAYARWLVLFVAAIAAGGYCAPRLLRPPPGVPTWLFFDGVCNLCDGFVNFVADGDSRKNIKFGAIQRHTELLETHGALTDLSTVVVVQGSKVYTRSSAVMRVLAVMDQPWRSFTLFYFIPSSLRDLGYRCAVMQHLKMAAQVYLCICRFVAHNRYWVFGKAEQCRAPTPEFESRFIEYEAPEPAMPFLVRTLRTLRTLLTLLTRISYVKLVY